MFYFKERNNTKDFLSPKRERINHARQNYEGQVASNWLTSIFDLEIGHKTQKLTRK